MKKANPYPQREKLTHYISNYHETIKYIVFQVIYAVLFVFIFLTFLYICSLVGNGIHRYTVILYANKKNITVHGDMLSE